MGENFSYYYTKCSSVTRGSNYAFGGIQFELISTSTHRFCVSHLYTTSLIRRRSFQQRALRFGWDKWVVDHGKRDSLQSESTAKCPGKQSLSPKYVQSRNKQTLFTCTPGVNTKTNVGTKRPTMKCCTPSNNGCGRLSQSAQIHDAHLSGSMHIGSPSVSPRDRHGVHIV